MSPYEANWELDLLVTAEAVWGIGAPQVAARRYRQALAEGLTEEKPQTGLDKPTVTSAAADD